MTRETFVATLREGLRGVPVEIVADLTGDFEAHFSEGRARGRSEVDIAEALGDPVQLARELRAEMQARRWEKDRSPSAAVAVVLALMGVGAINLLVFVPLLILAAALLLTVFITAGGVFLFGILLVVSPLMPNFLAEALVDTRLSDFVAAGDGGVAVATGFGLIFSAAAAIAASLLAGIATVNAAAWYGRLHYRLVRLGERPFPHGHVTKLTVIRS